MIIFVISKIKAIGDMKMDIKNLISNFNNTKNSYIKSKEEIKRQCLSYIENIIYIKNKPQNINFAYRLSLPIMCLMENKNGDVFKFKIYGLTIDYLKGDIHEILVNDNANNCFSLTDLPIETILLILEIILTDL